MKINSAKDLEVYKKAYKLAMGIFQISKIFPAEEKYALTSQIRRSSRSVCLNLREAWLPARRVNCGSIVGEPPACRAKHLYFLVFLGELPARRV